MSISPNGKKRKNDQLPIGSEVVIEPCPEWFFTRASALCSPVSPRGSYNEFKTQESESCGKLNALDVWPSIYESFKDYKEYKLAIFLDYDGTLTPIVDLPSQAVLSPSMREVILQISKKFSTAIVTGRKFETIYEFVKLDSLYYAGSHGFDIRGPTNAKMKQVASHFRPSLQKCYENFCEKLQKIPGALVEDNEFSISVHYRQVDPALVPTIEKLVNESIINDPKLSKKLGKKVFEIRPKIDWDKGKAVRWLLQTMFPKEKKHKRKRKQKNKSSCIIPIYLGDDVSDEDAFNELKSYKSSISIHVKGKAERRTAATYVLNNTNEVELFLTKLAKL